MTTLKLPPDKCGLTLEHNSARSYYQTVGQSLEEQDEWDWPSIEARQRAIDTNEIWTLVWFPETAVGSYSIAAPTLEELLSFAANAYPA